MLVEEKANTSASCEAKVQKNCHVIKTQMNTVVEGVSRFEIFHYSSQGKKY